MAINNKVCCPHSTALSALLESICGLPAPARSGGPSSPQQQADRVPGVLRVSVGLLVSVLAQLCSQARHLKGARDKLAAELPSRMAELMELDLEPGVSQDREGGWRTDDTAQGPVERPGRRAEVRYDGGIVFLSATLILSERVVPM